MDSSDAVPFPNDLLESLTKCLDATSISSMLTVNNQFSRVASRALHRIQPFYVESVVLTTPRSVDALAVRLDPAPYLLPDPPGINLPPQNPNPIGFGGIVFAPPVLSPLYRKMGEHARPDAREMFRTREDVYGSELTLNYDKGRSDKFVFMHPDSLEFSKKWPDEVKPHPDYQGFEEDMAWAGLELTMIPEERILMRRDGSGGRTLLVFTRDSVTSLGTRLICYIQQDVLKTFTIEKVCLSAALMDWLLQMKCTVSNIIIKKCMFTAAAPKLTNLLDKWLPLRLNLDGFGFYGVDVEDGTREERNPFVAGFWESKAILSASDISIRAYENKRSELSLVSYEHLFDANQMDLTQMKCHSLGIRVESSIGSNVNQLLKSWLIGNRTIRKISLKKAFDIIEIGQVDTQDSYDLEVVLEDIEKEKSYLRGNICQYVIRRGGKKEEKEELWIQVLPGSIQMRTHRFG